MSSTKKEKTNCDERSAQNNVRAQSSQLRKRRGKRDREGVFQGAQKTPKKSTKKKSKALQKHGKDGKGGGLESMIPSLIGVVVLVVAVMAQRGFRGRASVAGIDLGTTNSVICVQSPSKGVGQIDCISDDNGSPIVPSVVAFLQPEERKIGPSSKTPSKLQPHPSHVLVGHAAKHRIDTHPHHTLYHAKRVLGRDSNDMSVKELQKEVEFRIVSDNDTVMFQVDQYHIPPHQVGSYIINHLMTLAKNFLGHENVKSAVLAVPAKFTAHQRQQTALAFTNAGVQVARILEEPTAAALAYGLHRKDGVEKILVYDFGGGTLDISILHVSDGFVEVMGSDGDDRLGGADFDGAVAQFLAKEHSDILHNLSQYTNVDMEHFMASCGRITEEMPLCSVSSFHTLGEIMKIDLSEQALAATNTGKNQDVSTISRCLALPPPTSTKTPQLLCDSLQEQSLTMTLQDYNNACQSLFDRAVLPVTRLLEDLTLKPSDMDEIVMVGGTTRMPQIRQLVGHAFPNAELNTHIDPDITVAYGAASVID